MDYMTPLLSAEAYYQMGMINTSQRFFYESMESIADHQKSAYCLQRLVMTALARASQSDFTPVSSSEAYERTSIIAFGCFLI